MMIRVGRQVPCCPGFTGVRARWAKAEAGYDIKARPAAPVARPGAPIVEEPHMTHTIEISLRIPSLRVRREGKEGLETIANSDVRFIKHVELEAIPKAGDVLTMTVGSGGAFQCDVVRSDWHHDKNMFVTACRYSKRSISAVDYQALLDAPDWQARALL